MRMSDNLQEMLIAAICFDEKISPLLLSAVPVDQYDGVYQDIVKTAKSYIEENGKIPGPQFGDMIDELATLRSSREYDYREIGAVIEVGARQVVGHNPEYVLARASTFMRKQTLKTAIFQAAKTLEGGDVDQAEAIVSRALAPQKDLKIFDPGVFAFEDEDLIRAYLAEEHEESMPTGIAHIDERALGPARGQIHFMLAGTGQGKSWWFVHLMKMCARNGYRVLYVSLEMSRRKILRRLIQSMFLLTKSRALDVVRQGMRPDDRNRFEGFEEGRIIEAASIADSRTHPRILKSLRKIVRSRRMPSPIIRDFPTKSLTVDQLKSFLDVLESRHKVVPDLVIVDYAKLMAPDSSYRDVRFQIGDTVERLRGLAGERNIAIATAAQTNRKAKGAVNVGIEHIGEDYSQVQTADSVLVYEQSGREKRFRMARLRQDKGRDDEDHFELIITQDYRIGQFVMGAALNSSRYWTELKRLEDEEDGEVPDDGDDEGEG